MITLIDHGQPVLAVINNFILDNFYWAIKGRGAWLGEERLLVRERIGTRATVHSSIDRDRSNEEVFVALVKAGYRVDWCVASGHFATNVASGKSQAYVEKDSGPKSWDIAPGALLIAEAGGKVANIGSDKYDYRDTDIIASHPGMFDELAEIMSSLD